MSNCVRRLGTGPRSKRQACVDAVDFDGEAHQLLGWNLSGNNLSAGKNRSSHTTGGNQWLRDTLTECVLAAAAKTIASSRTSSGGSHQVWGQESRRCQEFCVNGFGFELTQINSSCGIPSFNKYGPRHRSCGNVFTRVSLPARPSSCMRKKAAVIGHVHLDGPRG